MATNKGKKAPAVSEYKKLLLDMPAGIAFVDGSGDGKLSIGWANPAFIKLTGLGEKSLEGASLESAFPGIPAEKLQTLYKSASTGKKAGLEIHLEKTGAHIDCVFFPEGTSGVAIICNDITERKVAEDALRESEERLDRLVWGAKIGLYDSNMQTGRAFYNTRYAEMLGQTLDEAGFSTKFWENRLHPEDKARVNDAMAMCIRGEKDIFEAEYRLRHKNGGWVWVMDRGWIVSRTPDGLPLRSVGAIQDVTERVLAREALSMSEERFRLIFENATEGIVFLGSDGKIKEVNPKTLELAGCSSEELVNQDLLALVKAFGVDMEAISGFAKIMSGLPLGREDWEFTDRYGVRKAIKVRPYVVKRGAGIIGFGAIMSDVTEQKRIEEKLAFQVSLLDFLDRAVVAADIAGNIVFWNKSAEMLHGWKADDVVGKNAFTFIVPDERIDEAAELFQHIKSGETWRGIFPLRHANGTVREMRSTAAPVRDANGEIIGFVGISDPISEISG